MNSRPKWTPTEFAFGGDYNPEQWPEQVWADDIRLMQEAGVSLVTVGVFAWSFLEVRRNEFQFGWLDRVMDLLADGGIGVDLATATASPPPWLTHEHPEILPVMDRKNIRMMVNLTGGCGPALDEVIQYWQTPTPRRFLVFTQPWFGRIRESGYSKMQADEIERARKIGARGIKVLKILGLGLRENVTTGKLIKVDDNANWQNLELLGCVVVGGPAVRFDHFESVAFMNCVFLYDGMEVEGQEWLAFMSRERVASPMRSPKRPH